MTAGQRDCLLFGAVYAPVAIACGGLSMLWAVPALALAALLYSVMRHLLPEGRSLADVLPRWLLVPELLFLIVAAAGVAAMAAACWPGGGSDPLFSLALLALGGAAAWQGSAAAGRCAGILTWAAIAFFALVLGAAVIEGEQPANVGVWQEGLPVWTVLLLPACGLFLPSDKGKMRFWAGIAVYTLLVLAVTFGKGGDLPLLTAVKGIELFGILQRFEALASCVLTAGLFLTLAVLGCSANEILRALEMPAIPGAAMIVPEAALLLWIREIPGWIFAAAASIFWGLCPLLALLLEGHRQEKKIRSKSEKKC